MWSISDQQRLSFLLFSYLSWPAQSTRGTDFDTGIAIPADLFIQGLIQAKDNLGTKTPVSNG